MTMIEHKFSNKAVWGLQNNALRYTWAGYYLFIILSSYIGDTTILIASTKYRAFKLHRVIVVNIQDIAFCDLFVSTTIVLPSLAAVIENRWVLGTFLCNLSPYFTQYFSFVSVLLIGNMTTNKLLLLKYPLRFGTMSSEKAHLVSAILWILALVLPALCVLIDWQDVFFSYKIYQCDFLFLVRNLEISEASLRLWSFLLHYAWL